MSDKNEEILNLFNEALRKEVAKSKPIGIPPKTQSDSNILKLELSSLVENHKNTLIYLDEEDELQFENLKESIKTEGLIHPLVAKKSNGKYTLISGHRRLKALKELVKEGYAQFASVYVKIMEFKTDTDEMEALLDANIAVRDFSDYSKMMQVAAYQKTFLERIKLNQLSDIQVEKTYIAKKMHMGERQVSKYLYIRKHLNNDDLKAMLDQKLSLNKIYELMKLHENEFNSELPSKLEQREPQKPKPLPKLTKEEQRKLLSLQNNINKLFEQNEKLILDVHSKKQVAKRLNRLSASLSSINNFIEELVNKKEEYHI